MPLSEKSNELEKTNEYWRNFLSKDLEGIESLLGKSTESMTIDDAIMVFQAEILPMKLNAKEQKYEGNVYEKFIKKIEAMEENVTDKLELLAYKEPNDEAPRYEVWEQKCEELEDLLYKYDQYKNALELIIKKSKK